MKKYRKELGVKRLTRKKFDEIMKAHGFSYLKGYYRKSRGNYAIFSLLDYDLLGCGSQNIREDTTDVLSARTKIQN
ncbi:MAG: hypothetical protein QXT48_05620 [Thermoplasmatales archaeon]